MMMMTMMVVMMMNDRAAGWRFPMRNVKGTTSKTCLMKIKRM